jgi:hypothetical protein
MKQRRAEAGDDFPKIIWKFTNVTSKRRHFTGVDCIVNKELDEAF